MNKFKDDESLQLFTVDLKIAEFDTVMVSLNSEPIEYVLQQYADRNLEDFTGKVLVDMAALNGNNNRRFIEFTFINNRIDEKHNAVLIDTSNQIRIASNNLLAKFAKSLKFSALNRTQVKLLVSGVSI